MGKRIIILLIILVPIVLVLTILAPIFIGSLKANYQNFKINSIKISDLTQTYTDTRLGFQFKYPKGEDIYKPTEDFLRILRWDDIKHEQAEIFCDISIDSDNQPRPNEPSLKEDFNGTTWIKWKRDERVVIPFVPSWIAHNVYWSIKIGGHRFNVSENATEGYCEKIVSTFKFKP